jgi:hypothetical protein
MALLIQRGSRRDIFFQTRIPSRNLTTPPAGEHLNDLRETAFPVDEDLFEIDAQGEEPRMNISLSPFFEEEEKGKAPEPRNQR